MQFILLIWLSITTCSALSEASVDSAGRFVLGSEAASQDSTSVESHTDAGKGHKAVVRQERSAQSGSKWSTHVHTALAVAQELRHQDSLTSLAVSPAEAGQSHKPLARTEKPDHMLEWAVQYDEHERAAAIAKAPIDASFAEHSELTADRLVKVHQPVDCVWDEWAAYLGEDCSKTCAGGTQRMTRKVRTDAVNGGAECLGSYAQVVTCNDAVVCTVETTESGGGGGGGGGGETAAGGESGAGGGTDTGGAGGGTGEGGNVVATTSVAARGETTTKAKEEESAAGGPPSILLLAVYLLVVGFSATTELWQCL